MPFEIKLKLTFMHKTATSKSFVKTVAVFSEYLSIAHSLVSKLWDG